jgi:hypothetical protein
MMRVPPRPLGAALPPWPAACAGGRAPCGRGRATCRNGAGAEERANQASSIASVRGGRSPAPLAHEVDRAERARQTNTCPIALFKPACSASLPGDSTTRGATRYAPASVIHARLHRQALVLGAEFGTRKPLLWAWCSRSAFSRSPRVPRAQGSAVHVSTGSCWPPFDRPAMRRAPTDGADTEGPRQERWTLCRPVLEAIQARRRY